MGRALPDFTTLHIWADLNMSMACNTLGRWFLQVSSIFVARHLKRIRINMTHNFNSRNIFWDVPEERERMWHIRSQVNLRPPTYSAEASIPLPVMIRCPVDLKVKGSVSCSQSLGPVISLSMEGFCCSLFLIQFCFSWCVGGCWGLRIICTMEQTNSQLMLTAHYYSNCDRSLSAL